MLSGDKIEESKRKMRRFYRWLWGLHLLAVAILGLGLFPMVALFYGVWKVMAAHAVWLKLLALSFSVAFGYFLFGTTLILVCVLAKNLFKFRIAPGLFPMYSIEALRWMGYNSLILIANSAFLDVLRISPFQTLFYRLMGAKVGRDGDQVVIGGGTALICHAVERGFLRLAPTRLGNRVSIGLGSVVMPDCEIGEGASLAPCSFLPKGSRVPPRAVWGGNPAHDLRAERRSS